MADQPRLRVGVRALVLDPDDRVLLLRFEMPEASFWACPGGGLKPDESHVSALRRELLEETGIADPDIGPEIWTRTHIVPFDSGYDGQTERIYLVRTEPFEPQPALSWEQLRHEHVTDIAWWRMEELHAYEGVFTPRRLPELVSQLVDEGPPSAPFDVGV